MFRVIEKDGRFYLAGLYGEFDPSEKAFKCRDMAERASKAAIAHYKALKNGTASAPSHGSDI